MFLPAAHELSAQEALSEGAKYWFEMSIESLGQVSRKGTHRRAGGLGGRMPTGWSEVEGEVDTK